MAEKRMFTKKITDSDEFISMSGTAQALYFHLNMSADDDGFNNQVQMAMFKAHASVDDVKVLLAKRFIIQFENGVIVIKHWRMANAIRKDRYTPTSYQEELNLLNLKENGSYTLEELRLPNGCQVVAVDKVSIDKNSIEKNSNTSPAKPSKSKYGENHNVLLTEEQRDKLVNEFGEEKTAAAIDFLDSYIQEKGYKSKEHYLSIRRWVFRAVEEQEAKAPKKDPWEEADRYMREKYGDDL